MYLLFYMHIEYLLILLLLFFQANILLVLLKGPNVLLSSRAPKSMGPGFAKYEKLPACSF
jgi:hypothetical protein